jgi:hypothetical protein
VLLFQPSAFISIWRASWSSCGCSTTVMVQMHATRNVLQRFYAPSVATAWVKIVLVVRHSCNGSTTSRIVDMPEVCEGQKPRARAICMDNGSLFCSVYVFFFFFLKPGPGSLPRKILGDKPQMNHDAEYDCRHQRCMLCQGVRLRGREVQRSIQAYLGHPGLRSSDVWYVPEPF